ncbi:DUF3379 domain-containing protein [Vibrio sp. SM6]|uniref:DUF3379 domain-containing protein n=1 Tax=Vibrio agarilyticus TaxID=2726741 RepID=A0A7X8TQZ5_9VIBR|nr:DUF3379 domain-containing protein [Vibrio agarilyticus]NLS13265.1 DUF3379 domain-containing protein [Vibrio agarilyticus]
MDDLEFRRRVLSDPRQRDDDIKRALGGNDANGKFFDDVLDLDAQIKQAMTIDVPDDLADKILFSQTSTAEAQIAQRSRWFKRTVGLAASIAFVGGLLVGQINWSNIVISSAEASLASTAIQHVVEEDPFVRHLDEKVSTSQINAKLAPFGYQLTSSFPYPVYYLNHCGFGSSNALHMVFQGPQGKVTLFFTKIDSHENMAFSEDGFDGLVSPVDKASLILVGEHGEALGSIAHTLETMLRPLTATN